MITKKEFLEALERNKSYQRALDSVNDEQRTKIRSILDSFMGHAVDNMAPVIDRLNKDPKLVEQVREHMRRGPGSDGDVVISEEPNASGSKAD